MKVRWIVLIGGVLLAALIGWFVVNFERVEKTVKVGRSELARRNDFLAAQRLLTEMGVETNSVPGLVSMPQAPEATLLLLGGRSALVGQRLEDLLSWVENGGRLVLAATPARLEVDSDDDDFLTDPDDEPRHVRDELLGRLGVDADPIEDPDAEVVSVALPEERGTADVQMRRGVDLRWRGSRPPIYQVKDERGHSLVVSGRLGLGIVTVVADTAWLTNKKISEHHHASFLWHLVDSRETTGALLVYGEGIPGLFELLFAHAGAALLGLSLLILTYLWYAGARFGPPIGSAESERRSILEHLAAAGRFLWRRRAQDALLETMRDDLERDLLKRRPDLARLDGDEKIRRVAKFTKMSEQRVANALDDTLETDAQKFTRVVRDLQTLTSKHD